MKAYKYKLILNKQQSETIDKWISKCRYVYNTALQMKIEHYKATGKTLSAFDISRQYTQMRNNVYDDISAAVAAEFEGLPRTCITNTLDRLELAFKSFFKNPGVNGFPKFKGKAFFNTLEMQGIKLKGDRFYIPNLGTVKHFKDRLPEGAIKTSTLSKYNDNYYLQVVAEYAPDLIQPNNDEIIGIDLGIARQVQLSTGDYYENPLLYQNFKAQERILQRAMSRRKKGSIRYKEAAQQLSKLKAKIANIRADYQHKVTRALVDNYAGFVLEDLKVKNMTTSAKGTIDDPGTNVKQKAGLNRSILDTAPGAFRLKLEYKAKEQQRFFTVVNPAYTSQTCPKCGKVDKANRKSQSSFECVQCGYEGNADHIAAINILRRGTAGGR